MKACPKPLTQLGDTRNSVCCPRLDSASATGYSSGGSKVNAIDWDIREVSGPPLWCLNLLQSYVCWFMCCFMCCWRFVGGSWLFATLCFILRNGFECEPAKRLWVWTKVQVSECWLNATLNIKIEVLKSPQVKTFPARPPENEVSRSRWSLAFEVKIEDQNPLNVKTQTLTLNTRRWLKLDCDNTKSQVDCETSCLRSHLKDSENTTSLAEGPGAGSNETTPEPPKHRTWTPKRTSQNRHKFQPPTSKLHTEWKANNCNRLIVVALASVGRLQDKGATMATTRNHKLKESQRFNKRITTFQCEWHRVCMRISFHNPFLRDCIWLVACCIQPCSGFVAATIVLPVNCKNQSSTSISTFSHTHWKFS